MRTRFPQRIPFAVFCFAALAAGLAAFNVTAAVGGTYTATFPAGAMTASSGTNTNTFSAALTVVSPPTITSIRPSSGNVTGGNAVSIDGTGLDTVTSVTIGGLTASILRQSATTMVVAPSGNVPGAYDVVATSASGVATVTAGFTYVSDDDLARDFSLTVNPSARWTYGWEISRGAAFSPYRANGLQPTNVDFWWNGAEPLLAHNGTASPIAPAGRNPIPPGGIAMHPGISGENSVARWTAPSAAVYHIAGSFTGLDQAGTTTDVSVLRNNNAATPLFTANVAEYNVAHPFAIDVSLAAGETIEFTVGFGGNGYGSDTTGVMATIARTGPALQCYVQITTPVTGDGVHFIIDSGSLVVPPSTSATLYADCFNPNFASAWSWSTSEVTRNIAITTPAAGQSATYNVSLVTPVGVGTVTAVLQASPSGAPVCSITPTTPMPLSPTSTGVFNIASSCSPAATSFTWGGTTVLTGQGTPAASMQVNVPGNAGYGYTALMTPANSAGTGAEATRVIWISPAQPSPSSLAFATTGVGSQSAAQTVTVTNYSNYFTPYLTVMPSSQFTVVANKCPSPVPVQSSCTIDVAFAPTAVGAQAGTLTISFPFPGNPSYTIALSGTATGAPAASPTPSSLTFAARTVNTTSAAQTVTLANSGNLSLAIASITVSGDFAFTSNCPASLPAGASCTINVTFTPLAVGARSGTLTITDNAAGSPHTIALSGTGLSTTAPVADVSPRSLLFNTQPVGTDSAMQAITVTNSGTAPLTFGPVTITGEFTLATIASTASPPPCPVTLSPGQSCQMGVIFHPAGVNLRQGTLSITTNASASPTVVNLSGNGLAPQPPQLSMDAGLSFGDQPVGTRSAGSAFAIKNVSAFVANIAELSASGDFGVSDTCTTIAPGATCSPLVTFQPSAVGARMGTLTVRTLRDAEPYVVTLSGTGTDNRVPAVELSVTHIGFGNSLLGMPETSQVILKNVGLAPLIVGGIAASDDFFTDASCITTIAPGATCTVHVTFLPSIAGHHIGSVTIDSNAAGTPHRVELTGTGCYVPSPGRARFGVLLCGS